MFLGIVCMMNGCGCFPSSTGFNYFVLYIVSVGYFVPWYWCWANTWLLARLRDVLTQDERSWTFFGDK